MDFIVRIYESRAGRMKYMGTYYHGMGTIELNRLRSKKYVKLHKLENNAQSYWYAKEIATLRTQIGWIDAVLAARADQLRMTE